MALLLPLMCWFVWPPKVGQFVQGQPLSHVRMGVLSPHAQTSSMMHLSSRLPLPVPQIVLLSSILSRSRKQRAHHSGNSVTDLVVPLRAHGWQQVEGVLIFLNLSW